MDERGSGNGASLSEEVPWRGPWGNSFTGYPGRYVKKVSGYGHLSPWGPFPPMGNLICGGEGTITGDFDR